MDEFPATQMLESTQVLEATQILGGDEGEDAGVVVVGRLEVGVTKHQIVLGDNTVGRDPKCSVYISNPSLSREHAVLEADRMGCTVHDAKSSNGTKKGGIRLKPHIRYDVTEIEAFYYFSIPLDITWSQESS